MHETCSHAIRATQRNIQYTIIHCTCVSICTQVVCSHTAMGHSHRRGPWAVCMAWGDAPAPQWATVATVGPGAICKESQ